MSTGLGVMIQRLGGNGDAVAALEHAIGRKLTGVALADDAIRLGLDDGSTLVIEDAGQSCCERRYMTCDDALTGFDGAQLVDVEVRDAPNVADEYGDHEVQFLVVKTSKGDITAETHNEHNGYYGGFAVRARLEPAGQ